VRIERAEIDSPGGFDHLSDDDLERVLIERLSELGLTVDALDADSDVKHWHSHVEASISALIIAQSL